MIKKRDKQGAMIVLTSYLFVIPPYPLLFFVFVPFLSGVAISTVGLASHADKKWAGIYLALAACLSFSVLLLLGILEHDLMIVVLFVVPAVMALSSLIMARYAKNEILEKKADRTTGAPF